MPDTETKQYGLDDLLTEQEAAKVLRCSARTLARRRAEGEISFIQQRAARGSRVCYVYRDLIDYRDRNSRRIGHPGELPKIPPPRQRNRRHPRRS